MLTRWALDFKSYVKRRRDVSWCACTEQKTHLRMSHAKSCPFEKQNKKPWLLFISGNCRVVHTGAVHAHKHTTGLTVQTKGLIRDERRPHIIPCKGPLSPFLLQWSVELWETNDLGATALCATAKEKEGGEGGGSMGGPASSLSSLPTTSPPCHPTVQHGGVSHASMQLLLQPSQQ